MRPTLQIHPSDNVVVALRELKAGEVADGIAVQGDVPPGHKVALRAIEAGDPVVKYGHAIGVARVDIPAGAHVHNHNVASALREDWSTAERHPVTPKVMAAAPRTFDGYRRPDGRVGVRNEVWVVPTVGCVNQASMKIAERANARFPAGGNFDGVFAWPHPFGCSQLGGDLDHTRRILAGLLRHPNAAAVLAIGLGCENNQMTALLAEAGATATGASRLRYFSAQQVGDEIEAGVEAVAELVAFAKGFHREPVPAKELILGMKCGGSDGFSGITANPLVGRVADRLTAQGGTTLLSEVPEMFGAEQVLLDRATDDATAKKVVGLVDDFRAYFRRYNQPIDENPSPGNKAGGLSTNADKSLGCLQKAGDAPVKQVLSYGEPVGIGGLGGVALVNAPGNDGVSATAMTVAGAHAILFTTGRGTPMGFPVPTMKIASNTDLATRKPGWIDFDAGRLLADDADADAIADALFDQVLDVASGRKQTRNEINGNREIAIWKDGVTL
jgi:altronate hydrolase